MAGCASQPVSQDPTADEVQAALDAEVLALVMPPATSSYIRIGVEYLPPQTSLQAPVAATPAHEPEGPWHPDRTEQIPGDQNPPPPIDYHKGRFDESQIRWRLHKNDIRAKRNPIERMTLRFLSEMIGDDRKRVQRSIGAPLLGAELRLSTDPMSNFLDERDREDQQRLLTENGTRMIRRPLRNALKELPLFNDVEHAIRNFKASNRKYTDRNSSGLGRVSLRIRGSKLEDPIELKWLLGGFRLASTLSYLKATFATSITEGLSFAIRSKYDYDNSHWRLSGNIECIINDFTTFNVLAGNEINILGGQFAYPGGPQSDEASKGVLLYFHHQF
jgi:hypothetical protein